MQVFGVVAAVVLLAIVGLILLRIVVSIALSLFFPLLLLAIGIGIGLWWAARRKGSGRRTR